MGKPNDDVQKNELFSDFLSMCRLCLTKSNVKVDIFNNDNQTISLPVRIMACASLEVSPSDQLPKQICDDCRYQLEKSYVFRKRCKISDTKLHRYVRKLNANKITHQFENSDDEDEFAESQEFFNARQQKKMQEMEKEREDRERDFQQRMKNFMEEERRRFHDEETKRLMEEHKIFEEEKQIVVHANTSSIQPKNTPRSQSEAKISETEITTPKFQVEDESNTEDLEQIDVLYDEPQEEEEEEEQDNLEQNDDEMEFTLEHEEPEEDVIVPDMTIEQNIKYEENDFEEDSECEPLTVKESDSSSDAAPLVLNRGLKSSNSLGGDQIEFSRKPDQKNQYTIKTVTSRKADYTAPVEESDNASDKPCPTDDIDFDHLNTAVRSILAQQFGMNVNGDIKFGVLKRRDNMAEVEVRTSDGTIIVMEVELDSILVDPLLGELKIFGCSQCSLSFSRKANLKRHESTHIKEKGMSCEFCEKWFPSKSGLDRHVRVHTGEKPFKCDICGKCFIQKEILKRHTMVHTGERPFKCQYCEKSFIQNDMLRFHINRKHSENPITELRKCPLCPKTFSYASGLSRHLTVHTGKLFPCTHCPKKFNDRSAHRRHLHTVHRVFKG